jgi:hypothetical protein
VLILWWALVLYLRTLLSLPFNLLAVVFRKLAYLISGQKEIVRTIILKPPSGHGLPVPWLVATHDKTRQFLSSDEAFASAQFELSQARDRAPH